MTKNEGRQEADKQRLAAIAKLESMNIRQTPVKEVKEPEK